uniref:BTB domain-containing protein n=1 Tax=Panagrolaimus sp. ES5 TaxID=591445 RepID=A0AC34FAQ5_9BILA
MNEFHGVENIPDFSFKFEVTRHYNDEVFLHFHSKTSTVLDASCIFRYAINGHENVNPVNFGCSEGTTNANIPLFHINDVSKYFNENGKMFIAVYGFFRIFSLKIKRPEPLNLTKILLMDEQLDFTGKLSVNKLNVKIQNGEQFRAHRMIMSSHSNVIARKFESSWEKYDTNDEEEFFDLGDFSTEVLRILKRFCYQEDMANLIDYENMFSLMQLSNFLDMPLFKGYIEGIAAFYISAETVVEISNEAERHECQLLLGICVAFMVNVMSKTCSMLPQKDQLSDAVKERLLQSAFCSK